ncbi:MAG TPA: M24 family metallopeptidase [Gaiellaceae bacterium]|nr:M24 family metallopeptidase [Gaiellaceae bacterium]
MERDVVIYADTLRSPELRHEVPIAIGDPFLYVEREGVRHVVVSTLEGPRVEELGGYQVHLLEEFGLDELRQSGRSRYEIGDELVVRALRSLGVGRAVVPGSFPVSVADHLRGVGIDVEVDRAWFDRRRRVKSGAELAGIRRAQAAAEAGMAAARALLREARTANGDRRLVVDGEPLTSERIKAAVSRALSERGATVDDFIVSHGPQSAIGHHLGSGQLRAGETIVIDLWPRDTESGCFADMTRTFVVGEIDDEIGDWHRLCSAALERALDEIRAGAVPRAVYDGSCEIFEAAGFVTQRTKAPGEIADGGFLYALGHGVGLDVHEEPLLGLLGRDDELLAGDVLAVEPDVHRKGFGGVRLEDLVLVTDEGAEKLTRFPYDLTP